MTTRLQGHHRSTAPARTRIVASSFAIAALLLAACSSDDNSTEPADSGAATTAAESTPTVAPTDPTAVSDTSTPGSSAVTGNQCPYVVDTSKADFYPIQPSFSAGYTASAQVLNSDTADWAYVLSADFPYSNWTAWYLYDSNGVPVMKLSDTAIVADPGSTNPFVVGNPVLASPRSFHIYFMPSTTPADVVSSMQADGKNVMVMPAAGSTPGVSIVSRSYWSFGNDGLGDYDRFGYGGPTNTPYPSLEAFLVDPTTGELTDTPVDDCGAQSQLPQEFWYDVERNAPVITFENAPVPTEQELGDLPKWLVQTGSFSGTMGKEFPPSPVPNEVQFYRNNASTSPYADVQSAPPKGNPPDACGGYVMANLPNDVVSLVHIPQVPTFPDYSGATAETLNQSDDYDVQFYSIVIYGATKQKDAYGTLENSQLGNRQIATNDDGSATVVLYPQSATQEQIDSIAAVVKANGWNLLRSGIQSALAPNLLTIREKGQNKNWVNAISANDVTQGAPCPQTDQPSLPLPQDPPSAQITQTNGMGLTAPAGENCTVDAFLAGTCLSDLQQRLKDSGQVWSATGEWPTQKAP